MAPRLTTHEPPSSTLTPALNIVVPSLRDSLIDPDASELIGPCLGDAV